MPLEHEKLIHDELARRCEGAVRLARDNWREHGAIHPTLLIWPEHDVRASDGEDISGILFVTLSADPQKQQIEIREAANEAGAYGLLLTTQEDGRVRFVFETEHGTRTWTYPIVPHGDVQVLGQLQVADNTEAIGIRWQLPQGG